MMMAEGTHPYPSRTRQVAFALRAAISVKPSSADGTWTAGSWESRTLPGNKSMELRSAVSAPHRGRMNPTRRSSCLFVHHGLPRTNTV